jgi:hypothetical protein
MGEALGCIYTFFLRTDGYQRKAMGVLGDIAWRKWCRALTDEAPTWFPIRDKFRL